jgi:Protein of unknown function (DUF1091)
VQTFVELQTFFVKIGIALPTHNGKFETFIQNTVSDVCKYFKNPNNNLMLRIFFNGQFRNKKIPPSCPVKPDTYYIEKFRINDDLMMLRSVDTKFLVSIDFCTKRNERMYCIINMKFYGEVKDKKKWQQELEMRRKNESS